MVTTAENSGINGRRWITEKRRSFFKKQVLKIGRIKIEEVVVASRYANVYADTVQ